MRDAGRARSRCATGLCRVPVSLLSLPLRLPPCGVHHGGSFQILDTSQILGTMPPFSPLGCPEVVPAETVCTRHACCNNMICKSRLCTCNPATGLVGNGSALQGISSSKRSTRRPESDLSQRGAETGADRSCLFLNERRRGERPRRGHSMQEGWPRSCAHAPERRRPLFRPGFPLLSLSLRYPDAVARFTGWASC